MTISPALRHNLSVLFSVPGSPSWPATLDRLTEPKAVYAKFISEEKPWHINCCWAYYCQQNKLNEKDYDMMACIQAVDQGVSLKTLVEAPKTLEAALKAMTRPSPFTNVQYLPYEVKVLVDGTRKAIVTPDKEKKGLLLSFLDGPTNLRIAPSSHLDPLVAQQEDEENTWFSRITLDRLNSPTLREVLCLWPTRDIKNINKPVNMIVVVKPEFYDEILNGLRNKETTLTNEIATLTTIRDLQASNKALEVKREQLRIECGL